MSITLMIIFCYMAKEFCKFNQDPESVDLKVWKLSIWVCPNHVIPINLILRSEAERIIDLKPEKDSMCHCQLEDGEEAMWQRLSGLWELRVASSQQSARKLVISPATRRQNKTKQTTPPTTLNSINEKNRLGGGIQLSLPDELQSGF